MLVPAAGMPGACRELPPLSSGRHQACARQHACILAPATCRYIYTGSACGAVYVYDMLTGHCVRQLRGHADCVRDCSWHPRLPKLASVSWDGTVVEWTTAPAEWEPMAVGTGEA